MNKLLLNAKGRNHIKIMPLSDSGIEFPEDPAEQIELCKALYKELERSDAKRLAIYKHRSKGYMITVWELNGLYYLVQCLRNEFGTFNNTIYISKDGSDLVAISKFLQENIDTIMQDYKDQILDARDWLVNEALKENDTGTSDPK